MSANISAKLTFRLIQQTPIIHFQHDQDGATLRATEVKPKLDRFIIKKLGGIKNIPAHWRIKNTEALDYKLRFQVNGGAEISLAGEKIIEGYKAGNLKDGRKKAEAEINRMYFGNMVSPKNGDNTNKSLEQFATEVKESYKETVLYKDSISMTVVCFIPELRGVMEENIDEFFLTHNFGCRQSKGFGGFLVKHENTSPDYLQILQDGGYRFFFADCGSATPSNMLNHAMTVYAVLKGGLNLTGWDDKMKAYKYPERYIKGYMQRAYLDGRYGSEVSGEKAFIKTKKPLPRGAQWQTGRRGGEICKNTSFVFIRAILGLADHYEYRNSPRTGNVLVYSLNQTQTAFDVQRFASPLLIKIVEGKMFFIFRTERFSDITNKTFYILTKDIPKENKTDGQKIAYIVKNGHTIKTPERFGSEETESLIRGFVEYFNGTAKQKLKEFLFPHNKSASLTLKVGMRG